MLKRRISYPRILITLAYRECIDMIATQTPVNLLHKINAVVLATLLTLSTSFCSFAGSNHKREANSENAVSIENFGKVDDHFYRGSQPLPEEYKQLAKLGIKTVIDLRNDTKDFAKSSAESSGLQYINFPMSDKKYPQPDTAQKFLEIANNPANWPVYVHCAGGRHRTGVMTAVYRIMVDGWDMDRSYAEMKQYDFYTAWGHQAMKDYIFDFYNDTKQKETIATHLKAAEPTVNATAAAIK